jgi:hypothetical protein
MPTVDDLTQDTHGSPSFNLSEKRLEVPAPPSNSIACFSAALTAGLRALQQQEQFAQDAEDLTEVNNARDAMYVFHSLQEAIRGVQILNMREYQAWQAEMAKWQSQVNNFGIGFAGDASPMPENQSDDDGDPY